MIVEAHSLTRADACDDYRCMSYVSGQGTALSGPILPLGRRLPLGVSVWTGGLLARYHVFLVSCRRAHQIDLELSTSSQLDKLPLHGVDPREICGGGLVAAALTGRQAEMPAREIRRRNDAAKLNDRGEILNLPRAGRQTGLSGADFRDLAVEVHRR